MAAIATQTVARGGSITFSSAAGGGDTFTAGDNVLLVVKNGDGSSHTFTPTVTKTVPSGTVTSTAYTVAAGATALCLLTRDVFAAADGTVAVAYSAVTSMSVAAVAV